LLRLFLGRVGDDDAAGRLLLGIDAADHNTVMQGGRNFMFNLRSCPNHE
jgi:hypothetical protein